MKQRAVKSVPNLKDLTFSGTAVWSAISQMAIRDKEAAYQQAVETVRNKIEFALTKISLEPAGSNAHKLGAMQAVATIREVLASLK